MKYRELGRTKLKVSEIALGCEGFQDKSQSETNALLSYAIENGVNFMDMYSPNPTMHLHIAEAIRNHPDFLIQAHLCTVWRNGQYQVTRNLKEVIKGFEDYFTHFGVFYFPIGMIHYVDNLPLWEKIKKEGILAYAKECKKKGKIGHIGISSHNPEVALAASECEDIDVIMFSVNPCYDLMPATENVDDLFDLSKYQNGFLNLDPKREAVYEECARRGVGIDVMKAYGGGELLRASGPAGVALTPTECIAYALDRPAVAAIMVGAHSLEEIKDALAYEKASEQERDYARALKSFPRISWKGKCMYCGHCAPCPKGISVADVTKFLNLAKAEGETRETVQSHYDALPHHAGECIQCGACNSRCPFAVDAMKNMLEAKEIFGK